MPKRMKHVQAAIFLPFKYGDRIIGAIGLDYEQTDIFPENERLVLLEQYVSWAGIAYENACRFEEQLKHMENNKKIMDQMEQRNAMMLFLYETSLAILQRLDIKELLEIIISKGAEYTKADGAYVFLPTENSDELERAIAIGAARESLGLRIKRGEGAAGKAWEKDEMVINNTYKHSQGHLTSCSKVEAIINFPLRRENKVVGVVGFGMFILVRNSGKMTFRQYVIWRSYLLLPMIMPVCMMKQRKRFPAENSWKMKYVTWHTMMRLPVCQTVDCWKTG